MHFAVNQTHIAFGATTSKKYPKQWVPQQRTDPIPEHGRNVLMHTPRNTHRLSPRHAKTISDNSRKHFRTLPQLEICRQTTQTKQGNDAHCEHVEKHTKVNLNIESSKLTLKETDTRKELITTSAAMPPNGCSCCCQWHRPSLTTLRGAWKEHDLNSITKQSKYCHQPQMAIAQTTSNLPFATDNHNISRPSFLWWNRGVAPLAPPKR